MRVNTKEIRYTAPSVMVQGSVNMGHQKTDAKHVRIYVSNVSNLSHKLRLKQQLLLLRDQLILQATQKSGSLSSA